MEAKLVMSTGQLRGPQREAVWRMMQGTMPPRPEFKPTMDPAELTATVEAAIAREINMIKMMPKLSSHTRLMAAAGVAVTRPTAAPPTGRKRPRRASLAVVGDVRAKPRPPAAVKQRSFAGTGAADKAGSAHHDVSLCVCWVPVLV